MDLFIGCDQTLYLNNLVDEVTGAYQDSATVSATLVQGAVTISVTYSYVSASNGDYAGLVTAAQMDTLAPGPATLTTTAVSGSYSSTWVDVVWVRYQT